MEDIVLNETVAFQDGPEDLMVQRPTAHKLSTRAYPNQVVESLRPPTIIESIHRKSLSPCNLIIKSAIPKVALHEEEVETECKISRA